ncbi:MAG: FG-GAP-like repeat-containing protein, partial [Bacteroidota bacterium]
MARLRPSKSLGTLALGAAAVVATPDADAQLTFVEADPSPFASIGSVIDGADVAPVFADYDGDGDFDLLYGDKYGVLRAFENIGTPEAPAFELARDTDSFERFLEGWFTDAPPALADLDGDGDLDLLSANYNGALRYFENVGTSQELRVAERIGVANPFESLPGPFFLTYFADLDADGDQDFISKDYGTTLSYYENVGDATNPAFEARIGEANPFRDTIFPTGATLGDGDGDGDLDLVIGASLAPELGRSIVTYQNVGTPFEPDFRLVPEDRDPFASIVDFAVTPVLVDLDGDNDLDLAIGTANDAIRYFENVTSEGVRAGNTAAFEAVSVPLPAATRDADGALLAWTHTGPAATYEIHRLLGSAGAFDLLGTLSATDGEAVRFHTGPLGDGVSEVR